MRTYPKVLDMLMLVGSWAQDLMNQIHGESRLSVNNNVEEESYRQKTHLTTAMFTCIINGHRNSGNRRLMAKWADISQTGFAQNPFANGPTCTEEMSRL
ncbi:hypothetical protein CDAR_55901 [Caerostris darwini]|uniref:Uncharacterized protein n=1 Tax=Caerostris darwini TaxID=1538125 RepID=A0AAV4P724_9ARAC|nr:hypothetical protein CDAR_55901 [Caerostris darwini]